MKHTMTPLANWQRFRGSLGLAIALASIGTVASAADTNLPPANPAFTNYIQKMPGSSVSFEMVAIPGGIIKIGSPNHEPGRDAADLPQREVTIKPFWMARFEVSWSEYLPYVNIEASEVVRNVDKLEGRVDADGISHPTRPYGSVYRERGDKGYPAMGMGLPAAMEYCRWISKKTGLKYRLPTEEEWEYACRAGSTNAYFWGGEPAQATEYAWFKNNSADKDFPDFPATTHPLGKLKPNPFGLYDIVGNVTEWCALAGTNAPHVARGGAFSEEVAKLRCAARMIETPDWNELDPQSPQSIWWLASADFIGFRAVRSFEDEPMSNQDIKSNNSTAPTSPTPAGELDTNSSAVPLAAASTTDVKGLYKKYCTGCHGATGKGDTALGRRHKARDYTSPAVKKTLQDDAMLKAIKEGITVDGKVDMGAYADKIPNEADLKALVDYMKAF